MWVLAKAYQHQKTLDINSASAPSTDNTLPPPTASIPLTLQQQSQHDAQLKHLNMTGAEDNSSAPIDTALRLSSGDRDGELVKDSNEVEASQPNRFDMSWRGAKAYRNLAQLHHPRVVTPPRIPQQNPHAVTAAPAPAATSKAPQLANSSHNLTLPPSLPSDVPAKIYAPRPAGRTLHTKDKPEAAIHTLSSLAPEMLSVASGMLQGRLNEYEAQGLCLLLYSAASIAEPLSSAAPATPLAAKAPAELNAWQYQQQQPRTPTADVNAQRHGVERGSEGLGGSEAADLASRSARQIAGAVAQEALGRRLQDFDLQGLSMLMSNLARLKHHDARLTEMAAAKAVFLAKADVAEEQQLLDSSSGSSSPGSSPRPSVFSTLRLTSDHRGVGGSQKLAGGSAGAAVAWMNLLQAFAEVRPSAQAVGALSLAVEGMLQRPAGSSILGAADDTCRVQLAQSLRHLRGVGRQRVTLSERTSAAVSSSRNSSEGVMLKQQAILYGVLPVRS